MRRALAAWRARRRAASERPHERLLVVSGALRAGLHVGQALELLEPGAGGAFESRVARLFPGPEQAVARAALMLAREHGASAARLLEAAARHEREREIVRARLQALLANGLLSAYVVAAAPVVLLVIQLFLSPGAWRIMIGTERGRAAALAAVAAEALGLLWVRRIARVDV